ncbi:CNDP dipeptidase [Paxillus ammoniavirescens]|nr:CNDP dipeptidase [Paxillus ammoniavirescens]
MGAHHDFLVYVDKNADKFIQRLADAVKIKSISGDAGCRQETINMGHWLQKRLDDLGVATVLRDLGQCPMQGQLLDLPPAILGRLGEDPKKKTVLIYGHYDVQPALKSDGWDTDPFELVRKDDQLFGRGSTDDKGPIMGWLNVLEAHQKQGLELPVNLRFCFEGMEESGSEGLDELIEKEVAEGEFFKGVDCVCISDNYWLNTRTPALTYGLRGIAYFALHVSGPGQDLHSGLFGRMVHEPMIDLVKLMSKLVDHNGNILVPGIEEMVPPPDEHELNLYTKMDYSLADVAEAAGASIALSDHKETVLMGRMRNPSLSLHGIQGAFSEPGCKTVIPSKVSGKFSLRLVPPQTPELVIPLVTQYIQSEFAKLNSKNKMTVEYLHGGKPWVADVNHWNFEAAKKAIETIWKKTPDYTREGGSIPVTLTFAEKLGVNVLLLPMGRADDGAHSTNEKLDISNFIEGTKVLGTYLYEVAALTGVA